MKHITLLIFTSLQLLGVSQSLKRGYSVLSVNTGIFPSTLKTEFKNSDNNITIDKYNYLKFNTNFSTEKVFWKHFGASFGISYSIYPKNNNTIRLVNHFETKVSVIPHIINSEKIVVSTPLSFNVFDRLKINQDFHQTTSIEIGVRSSYQIDNKIFLSVTLKYSSQTIEGMPNLSITEVPFVVGLTYILDKAE